MTSMVAVPSVLQFWSMASHRGLVLPGCLGSHHLVLLFLFLLQSGMSMYDFAVVAMHIPGISSLIYLWRFLILFLVQYLFKSSVKIENHLLLGQAFIFLTERLLQV